MSPDFSVNYLPDRSSAFSPRYRPAPQLLHDGELGRQREETRLALGLGRVLPSIANEVAVSEADVSQIAVAVLLFTRTPAETDEVQLAVSVDVPTLHSVDDGWVVSEIEPQPLGIRRHADEKTVGPSSVVVQLLAPKVSVRSADRREHVLLTPERSGYPLHGRYRYSKVAACRLLPSHLVRDHAGCQDKWPQHECIGAQLHQMRANDRAARRAQLLRVPVERG